MVCPIAFYANMRISGMFEALQFEFMQNALIAGALASIICGIIGTLVVVNRLAFLSGGIAHAAYGGIGLAFYFGLPIMVGTLGFALLAALLMAVVTLKARHRSDTIVGVMWAVGMALGVILIDLTPGYNVDLMSYLFCSILTVPQSDLWQMLVITLLIIGVVIYFYNDFLAMSYDSEFARLRNIPVRLLYFLLLSMIAVSVVILIRVVGLILVIALLTLPAAMANLFARRLWQMMLLATVACIVLTTSGLALSYAPDLPAGAVTILLTGAAYFLTAIVKKK